MFIFRKEKSIPDDLCDAFIETFETCPESYRHRGVVSHKKDGVYQDKDVKLSTEYVKLRNEFMVLATK